MSLLQDPPANGHFPASPRDIVDSPLPASQRAIERRLRAEVRDDLSRLLARRGSDEDGMPDAERVRALIQDRLAAYQREAGATGKPRLVDPVGTAETIECYLVREGPLTRLLAHPRITDIWVNRSNRILYRLDGEVHLANEVFDSDEDVQQLTKRLIAPLGLRLDTSWPFVDTRLPGGPRLHAAIPPATTRHAVLSLRKYTVTARNVTELVWPEQPSRAIEADGRLGRRLVPTGPGALAPVEPSVGGRMTGPGMLPGPVADFLVACVRAGIPIVISGAPGSGKTTLMRALAGAIPPASRVLTLEDVPELDLEDYLPNCIALHTRTANVEGKGAITLRDLVHQALRMAPEYVLLGEVRGNEAWDVLNALQSGYHAMLSIHGFTCEDAAGRLAMRALEAGTHMNYEQILQFVAANVPIVVQVRRDAGQDTDMVARHRVVQVYEVTGMTGNRSRLQGHNLWTLDVRTNQLVWTGTLPRCLDQIGAAGVAYAPPPARPELVEQPA